MKIFLKERLIRAYARDRCLGSFSFSLANRGVYDDPMFGAEIGSVSLLQRRQFLSFTVRIITGRNCPSLNLWTLG